MKLFFNNDNIDSTVKEIRLRLRTSMNGEVSQSMKKRGANYHIIYGVEYPRLKNIAKNYTPNADLAYRLWSINIRETMILATLLQPIDTFTHKDANQWIKNINQIELVEYLCMNLLSKVHFAKEFVWEWVASENIWHSITALTLAARIANQFDTADTKRLLAYINEMSDTSYSSLHQTIAMSRALIRLCEADTNTAQQIKNELKSYNKATSSTSHQYIYQEVMATLSFLE